MRTSVFGAAALLLRCAAGSVVESLPGVPPRWTKVRDADAEQPIRLRIALEQPNLHVFEQTLYDISTPQNPLYGRHLSREQVAELMKPREESTAAVIHWLTSAGVAAADIEDAGEWVNFQTTVGVAEDLLKADFAMYRHEGATAERLRTLKYSVPEDVLPHITMIQPTTRFGQMKAQRNQVFESSESANQFQAAAADIPTTTLNETLCNSTITPECLRALYKVGDYKAATNVSSILGVSGFLEEYAKHDALNQFLGQFAPYAKSQNFTTVLVNGGKNDQKDTVNDDVEANLDMQYAASLGFETDIVFYSVGGRAPLIPDLDQPNATEGSNEPYLDFVNYLVNLTDDELPRTLTTSYGEDEQSVPKEYAQKVCTMFGQLGARGVSIIFSSGDTGPGSGCMTNDGTNTTRLLPIFPAACPYVTSVGGTVGVAPERAVSFSSGGFSDLFARPAYQNSTVSAYLDGIGDTFSGLFNAAGRGFPDVAAQGAGFQVVSQGKVQDVAGTSASAPTFAGLVSLLNNALVAGGKAPLGFMNPWLYGQAAAGFTDIVDGGSKGCTGRDSYSGLKAPRVIGAGWNATEGWDPVTGLGTPLFDTLLDLLMDNTNSTSNSSVAGGNASRAKLARIGF